MAPSSFRCYGQIVPATGAPRRVCAKGETVTRARMDELCELCADPSQPKLYKARRVSCAVELGSFARGEGHVLFARMVFEFSRGAWHYNWLSSRNGPKVKHALNVFFFAEYPTDAAGALGAPHPAPPGGIGAGADGQSATSDAMALALIGLGTPKVDKAIKAEGAAGAGAAGAAGAAGGSGGAAGGSGGAADDATTTTSIVDDTAAAALAISSLGGATNGGGASQAASIAAMVALSQSKSSTTAVRKDSRVLVCTTRHTR